MLLMGLPAVVLFILSLGGYLSSEAIKGIYGKQNAECEEASYKFTATVSIFCALATVLLSGFSFPFSWFSLLLGCLFGVAVMGCICASALAIQVGPWSYTIVMVSLAIVIPTFSGAIFWDEPIGWLDFVGLGLMVVCFVLSVQKKDEDKKGNLKWLLLSVLAMFCMAAIGIMQKIHQTSIYKGEVVIFLTTAFLIAGMIAYALYFIQKKRNGKRCKKHSVYEQATKQKSKKRNMIVPLAGICMALNHNINLYLAGALDSVVFFPIMCVCELIGVTLTSLLFFKEKMIMKQWIGLLCGVVAVILLCI